MKYVRIPGLLTPVSRIVLGTTALDAADQSRADALLNAAFAKGINTFDTARIYPNDGEVALGRWIRSRGLEGRVNVLTKGAHHDAYRRRVTPEDIEQDCRESIARLGVKTIDLYLLHRDDPSVPVGPIVECLNRLHEEGLIRVFGGSNWTAARLAEANAYAEAHGLLGMSVSSPHYALGVEQCDTWGGGVSLTGAKGAAERAFYRETGMPVFAYSSLCHGLLSGKWKWNDRAGLESGLDEFALRGFYCDENLERLRRCEVLAADMQVTVAQLALAWVLCQRENVLAVTKASSPKRLPDMAAATEIILTEAQRAWMNLGTKNL